LNGIIDFSDLLAAADLTEEQQEHLNYIRESERNLMQLSNDLLDDVAALMRPKAPATDNDRCGQSEMIAFSGHVLVADDDPGNQRLAKRILERLGFDVATADDGAEAVEKAENCEFDMIFMDVQMPVMDGFRATRLLRQKEIATPVIALTAHAFKEDRARCFEAGCDDYIAKPIDHDIFVKIIAQHACPPVPTA